MHRLPVDNGAALMVGATPPPYHGSIMMFKALMESTLRERFRLLHMDISDHRDLKNLGRLDLENVRLGLQHTLDCYRVLKREQPELAYVPVVAAVEAPASARPAGLIEIALGTMIVRVPPEVDGRLLAKVLRAVKAAM